jgi:hypothetical protein
MTGVAERTCPGNQTHRFVQGTNHGKTLQACLRMNRPLFCTKRFVSGLKQNRSPSKPYQKNGWECSDIELDLTNQKGRRGRTKG